LSILVTGPTGSRRKRGIAGGDNDMNLNLLIQKCFFTNCIPPPDPELTPPPTERPSPFYYWHENIWSLNTNTSVREATLDGTDTPPASGSDVTITAGVCERPLL